MHTPRNTGFTLIEMLVVVFIVGLMFAGVTVFISEGGADRRMDRTVERFAVVSGYISDLAVLAGEPIGLMLEPPQWQENPLEDGWRYRWQKQTAQGWQDLEEIPPVEIENLVELVVFINEQEWEYENAPEERLPIVAFYPSGEVTPFEIEFSHEELPGETETVLVDVWGEVVWKERQEAEEEEGI